MSISIQKLIQLALQNGFTSADVVKTEEIPFEFSFRDYCAENLCGDYDRNYTCPPDCGTAEAMYRKILSKPRAIVLQTVWKIRDRYDYSHIEHCRYLHNEMSILLKKQLLDMGCDGFVAGCSCCMICSPCLKQIRQPCPYPEDQYSCLSSYCVYVKKLADLCGMSYSGGAGKIAFFGLYVCD